MQIDTTQNIERFPHPSQTRRDSLCGRGRAHDLCHRDHPIPSNSGRTKAIERPFDEQWFRVNREKFVETMARTAPVYCWTVETVAFQRLVDISPWKPWRTARAAVAAPDMLMCLERSVPTPPQLLHARLINRLRMPALNNLGKCSPFLVAAHMARFRFPATEPSPRKFTLVD
ncbi:hypothetical protein [Georgenia daeguensis]|uniref:hypothetical protein n=1 Tax=Georgenia daeguensis TaxID=908355 RepID=UPI0031ECE871